MSLLYTSNLHNPSLQSNGSAKNKPSTPFLLWTPLTVIAQGLVIQRIDNVCYLPEKLIPSGKLSVL